MDHVPYYLRYPEHQKYWENPLHQRMHFEQLAKSLNVVQLSDWQRLSSTDLKSVSEILKLYDNSIQKALFAMYPDRTWTPVKRELPRVENPWGWSNIQNQREFFDKLATELCR